MRLTQVSAVSLVASLAALFVVCLRPPGVRAQSSSPPGGYLPIDGVKLYYEECGSGASINVVLIHDGLLDSVTWEGIWAPLCAKYHVLRYDRRSYGRSDAATAPYAPTNDLLAMMRHAKMDRAILVGNSSGAALALDFAVAHPEMTEGLFLLGPVVHGMPTTPFTQQRGNAANAPLAQNNLRAAAENWSRDPFLISGAAPETRRKLLEALQASPQNLKIGGQFERQPVPPTVARLSEIQAPTLVLLGDADIPDVMIYSGAIEAALPITFLELWKDAGHMIQLQQPGQLAERFQRSPGSPIAGRPAFRPILCEAMSAATNSSIASSSCRSLETAWKSPFPTIRPSHCSPPRFRAFSFVLPKRNSNSTATLRARYRSSSYTMRMATTSSVRAWRQPPIHSRKLLW